MSTKANKTTIQTAAKAELTNSNATTKGEPLQVLSKARTYIVSVIHSTVGWFGPGTGVTS